MPFCPSLNALRSLRRMTMRLLGASNLKQKFCVKFRKLFNPESLALIILVKADIFMRAFFPAKILLHGSSL